jgi:hypothetical protein
VAYAGFGHVMLISGILYFDLGGTWSSYCYNMRMESFLLGSSWVMVYTLLSWFFWADYFILQLCRVEEAVVVMHKWITVDVKCVTKESNKLSDVANFDYFSHCEIFTHFISHVWFLMRRVAAIGLMDVVCYSLMLLLVLIVYVVWCSRILLV